MTTRDSDIVLETPRLVLRAFRDEDLPHLAASLGDPHTMVHYPRPYSREEAAARLRRDRLRFESDGLGLWSIVEKATGEWLGYCGLTVQFVEGRPEVEVGYLVRRDRWGQGIATEAAAATLEHAFAARGLTRVAALVRPVNAQSRRVAEKIGMRAERDVTHADLPHLLYVAERGGGRPDAPAASAERTRS